MVRRGYRKSQGRLPLDRMALGAWRRRRGVGAVDPGGADDRARINWLGLYLVWKYQLLGWQLCKEGTDRSGLLVLSLYKSCCGNVWLSLSIKVVTAPSDHLLVGFASLPGAAYPRAIHCC